MRRAPSRCPWAPGASRYGVAPESLRGPRRRGRPGTATLSHVRLRRRERLSANLALAVRAGRVVGVAERAPQPHPVQPNRLPDAGEDTAGKAVLAEGVHSLAVCARVGGGPQRRLALPGRQREAVQTREAGDDADEARYLAKVLDDLTGAGSDRELLGLVAGEQPCQSQRVGLRLAHPGTHRVPEGQVALAVGLDDRLQAERVGDSELIE